MKLDVFESPRRFFVDKTKQIEIEHVADCVLEPNQMLTFIGPNNQQHDVVAKDWGFYATSSINHRLANNGFETFLTRSKDGKLYLVLVYLEKRKEFEKYCAEQNLEFSNVS